MTGGGNHRPHTVTNKQINYKIMKQTLLNREQVIKDIQDVLSSSAYLTEGDEDYSRYGDALDEYAEMYAEGVGTKWVQQMEEYAHRSDTSIFGNFNDIRRDYEREHEGAKFADLLDTLERGTLSADELAEVQAWALSWMWETFGTFGIKYNFETDCGELVYSWEQEDEAEAVAA